MTELSLDDLPSRLCKPAVAAETGKLCGHIVTLNLTFVARKGGVELVHPAEGSPA